MTRRISSSRPMTGVAAIADSLGIRDLLDIATVSVADLSVDGRWLAASVATRRDALGADFTRDGDQTYLRASVARLLVIDTRTGTQRPVFPTKRTVRGPTWSPDGTRLAMLLLENDAWHVTVWDRASGKFTTATMPAGRLVATIVGTYLTMNLFFGSCYMAIGVEAIGNADVSSLSGRWLSAIGMSVQTLTTVGYGSLFHHVCDMAPGRG